MHKNDLLGNKILNDMKFSLRYRASIIIKALSPFISENSSILDIGCGNGVVSKVIADNLKCKITGTDILDYAKEEISFKPMPDGTRLDFKDNSFEIGMINDALHHIPAQDQIKLVKEAMRVCRIVFIFEVKPTFIAKISDVFMNKIHNGKMPLPLSHRTRKEWSLLFGENDIIYEYFPVRKPSYLYPIENYLFRLENF